MVVGAEAVGGGARVDGAAAHEAGRLVFADVEAAALGAREAQVDDGVAHD